MLNWLRSVDSTNAELTLEDLREEPAVYLLAECNSMDHAERLLGKSCARIFEEQLDGWYGAPENWPKDRSIRNFRRWFSYTFHSMIIDLDKRSSHRRRSLVVRLFFRPPNSNEQLIPMMMFA